MFFAIAPNKTDGPSVEVSHMSFVELPFSILTCHDEGNGSATVGEEHGPVGGLAGENPLVVALPRDSSKYQQEPVVHP